jgi:hypothetical protein
MSDIDTKMLVNAMEIVSVSAGETVITQGMLCTVNCFCLSVTLNIDP